MNHHQFLQKVPTFTLEAIKMALMIRPEWMHSCAIHNSDGINQTPNVPALWKHTRYGHEILKFVIDEGFMLFDSKYYFPSLGDMICYDIANDGKFPPEYVWLIENWTKEMMARNRVREVSDAVSRMGPTSIPHVIKGGIRREIALAAVGLHKEFRSTDLTWMDVQSEP